MATTITTADFVTVTPTVTLYDNSRTGHIFCDVRLSDGARDARLTFQTGDDARKLAAAILDAASQLDAARERAAARHGEL